MDHGSAFLRSQVHNAVVQHGTFLRSLEDHEAQADDPRFRDLCSRHITHMREHQRMLESYQKEIGAEAGVAVRVMDVPPANEVPVGLALTVPEPTTEVEKV